MTQSYIELPTGVALYSLYVNQRLVYVSDSKQECLDYVELAAPPTCMYHIERSFFINLNQKEHKLLSINKKKLNNIKYSRYSKYWYTESKNGVNTHNGRNF